MAKTTLNQQSASGAPFTATEAPTQHCPSPSPAASGHASFAAIFAPTPHRLPVIYPGYIAVKIKHALIAARDDREPIIEYVDEIKSVGDGRYVVSVTDHLGTRYRVTVEVDDGAQQ